MSAVVGVVGSETGAVESAVSSAGGAPETGSARAVVDDAEYVVAVGESALFSVARARPAVPILPVDAGRGVRSVPADRLDAALESLLAGDWTGVAHPLLGVRVADRTATTALQDVLLVSAEPAHISEYGVSVDGARIARFRADGVVVATPAGSSGYARAADGPVVAPGTGALVVQPVAPFSTDLDGWVVEPGDVRITVERDETPVHLVADDRVVDAVSPPDPVAVSPSGAVETAVVGASRSWYADR